MRRRCWKFAAAWTAGLALCGATPSSAEAGLLRAKKASTTEPEVLPRGPAVPQAVVPYAPAPYGAGPYGAAPNYPSGPAPHVVYVPVPMPMPVGHPTPKISYRHAALPLRKVKGDPCRPPFETVLCVVDPCTKCPVYVPVCLPNCCCEAPAVSCGRSLLRGDVTTFAWCCGVRVEVRFAKCGDVLVTYRGT